MKPEDIERRLVDDAAGVGASPRFAGAVMAAVRREAEVPPPIPFPWKRASPGIAAGVLAVAGSWFAAPSIDARSGTVAADALARSIELVGRIGDGLASVDPSWIPICIAVVALTVVPVAAPFWLVSAARDS